MNYRKYISMAFLGLTLPFSKGNAQTYYHEANVLDGFTIAEIGGGRFSDVFYATHPDYRGWAMTHSKLALREELGLLSLRKETKHAEALDSALVDRGKAELANYLDRSQPGIDLTYMTEKNKIEKIQNVFARNIEMIQFQGGSREEYNRWRDIYKRIDGGLQAIRGSYMPSGARMEQYLAIYQDYVKQNSILLNELEYLSAAKAVSNRNRAVPKLDAANVGEIARARLGAWKERYIGVMSGKIPHTPFARKRKWQN